MAPQTAHIPARAGRAHLTCFIHYIVCPLFGVIYFCLTKKKKIKIKIKKNKKKLKLKKNKNKKTNNYKPRANALSNYIRTRKRYSVGLADSAARGIVAS